MQHLATAETRGGTCGVITGMAVFECDRCHTIYAVDPNTWVKMANAREFTTCPRCGQ